VHNHFDVDVGIYGAGGQSILRFLTVRCGRAKHSTSPRRVLRGSGLRQFRSLFLRFTEKPWQNGLQCRTPANADISRMTAVLWFHEQVGCFKSGTQGSAPAAVEKFLTSAKAVDKDERFRRVSRLPPEKDRGNRLLRGLYVMY